MSVRRAARAALGNLLARQFDDGRWEGEMAWNTMLLSQYLLTHRMLRVPLSASDITAARRHYEVTQLPDGAWPVHSEGPGSAYVTTLAYVALRALDVPPDDPLTGTARTWLGSQPGGVLALPAWGRMWLAMLGLYDYRGINSIPPELTILPGTFPLHPDQLYCHTRFVYLGLACLYGRRAVFGLEEQLIGELRQELFDGYGSIDFAAARTVLCGSDLVLRPHLVLRVLYGLLASYERAPLRWLRRRALAVCSAKLRAELSASRGHGISPVSALLAILVAAHEGRPHQEIVASLRALDAWRWLDDEEGLRIAGARSSAWDTAFVLRALLASKPSTSAAGAGRAYQWLCAAQQTDELAPDTAAGRDAVLGGWCFSDGSHRWAVSDCTAEALSSILMAHDCPEWAGELGDQLPAARVRQAVDFVLARQNPDGGFGTYERMRSPQWTNRLNPSEMYLDCMTERSHVECSASCVAALARFAARDSGHRHDAVAASIRRGVSFLRARQRPDGAYPASWGIHFTYSAFFVVEALSAAGVPSSDRAIAGLVRWLETRQKPDGSWGEHYESCLTGEYVEHPEGQAAMTAWAVLALIGGGGPQAAIDRGLRFLADLQQPDGSWPQQASSGVFFGSAVLDYRLYRQVFPAWALGEGTRLTSGPAAVGGQDDPVDVGRRVAGEEMHD
ncbi:MULTISPECIES: prenyltransferase/squalene oxidase repeat-containing protein [Amycolatopsis]|uniref:Prenyltransferase/squalene oxidase repeat-containing protein n=1 Tax=Amycolatopsis albidoflavus TaxID=102226 RepID=A0ABW5I7M3_9PSEU